ncbi:flagellar basal-body MS-ring/collar protein FliF [Priestia megaterium]|uniref:flagellar basal-body MS-ring/collar protein FliF n=1 Tax=Priestia megaterium TaxID=1404 RepID=UPI0036DAA925
MNERIALYRDKVKVFWNNRKKGQKITLVGPLAAILVIVLASIFLTKEKFVPLYSNLSAQETGQIKAELNARSVPSEISDDGTTISVPEQCVDSLKVDLAAQGIPDSGSIDYSFFGKNASFDMADNEFDGLKFDVLQTELANLMKNIQGVNNAKVMITLPNESI